MNKSRIRLGVATIALLGLSAAGVAAAQAAPSTAQERSTTTSAQGVDQAAPTVEHQTGIVVEASGASGSTAASVTVYENSQYGNSVQVVLGEDLIGYAEPATAVLVDGAVHVTVEVDGRTATLTGTLAPTGRPEKTVEPTQDAGEQIVTRGTHTALAGELTLTYDGVTVPLHLDNAFAYDLEVRRVALYGR
jgi:hypothetical protein